MKSKTVLCDINIILDVLLKREPYFDKSFQVLNLINKWKIKGYISWISIDTIAYILKRNGKDIWQVKWIIEKLLQIFYVAEINKWVLLQAVQSDFQDIEDAIQYYSALHSFCDILITRNIKDFISFWDVFIISPENFIQ